MSFKDKFDYKRKLIVGIIVFIIGLLFVYFTTGFSRSSFIPASNARYASYMSIILLIPSILLLIPMKNDQINRVIKYIIYGVLIIFILYCLLCLQAFQGPFLIYYIIALLFILINMFCNYIR